RSLPIPSSTKIHPTILPPPLAPAPEAKRKRPLTIEEMLNPVDGKPADEESDIEAEDECILGSENDRESEIGSEHESNNETKSKIVTLPLAIRKTAQDNRAIGWKKAANAAGIRKRVAQLRPKKL
ncbi:MAG: hypothetical protein Q9218_002331, partial [Villophora microphyllina]